jgi:23S rRNA (guanosine2251-2'-O)-methyltransferase
MSDRDRKPPFRRSGGKPFEKGRKPPGRPAWRDREASPEGPAILYGWHTVAAALANPERQIRKLLLTENAARRLADENIDTRVTPEIVRPSLIDQRLGPDAVHQGLLAEADPLPSPDIDTLAQEGIVLVLDQITDPHNVGAILRSRGFLTVGLDSEGAEDLGKVELRAPLALVLGAEGKGLRQLTRETCATVARLDMPGEIKSLNVSNAAVLALYIGASRLGLM